jgi:hypothetical protein
VTRWVADVCRLPLAFRAVRAGEGTVLALFEPATPHLADREGFLAAVTEFIRSNPELTEAWVGYSEDKRTGSGPYVLRRDEGAREVGFFEHGYQDVRRHHDEAEAVADFIYREAAWVLKDRRVI